MSVLSREALIPRSTEGMGRGLGLALLVHALLLIAIAFGVSWRSRDPAGIEAELWAAVPQVAAPRAVEPEPKPEPPKRVEPTPPPPPPPPKAEPTREQIDAQIAIEKARREEEKRQEEARLAAEKRKLEEQRRAEEEKRKEQERLAALERQKEEQERKRKEAQAKRLAAESERKAAEQRAELRKQQLDRIAGIAGGSGSPTSTGTAARSAGPSAGYAGRIKARILPNIVFSDSVSGNPLATVEVRAAPDGTIIGRRLIRSSGVPAWDEAVLRAIDKTEVLPRDTDGSVPSSFEIAFRVRE